MKHFCAVLIFLAGIIGSLTGYSQVLLTEHVILDDFQGATCISNADFNGDGFIDLVVTGNTGNLIGWFENDGNQNFTKHIVVTGFLKAKGVVAAKIDANETWDFVATSKTGGKFSWFSNDGTGNFSEHLITDSTWTSADFVDAADIDGDADQDLILIACDNNKIAWAENDGSGAFTVRMLKENWTKANWGSVADMDHDGDMDIVATAKAGQIIWFRNDGLENFSQDTLYGGIGGFNSVRVADFDGDGDNDLAATACDQSDLVAWFENDGNYNFVMHLLKDNYNGARACEISDLDQDGDMDILTIAWAGAQVTFWDNDGKGNFTERVICNTAYDMIRIQVTDLDQDNDPDILGACFGDQEIRWWESIYTFLVPEFTADSLSGHHSLHVSFTDLSNSRPGIKTWNWDFDNDGTIDSQEQNPEWLYSKPGTYTVRLIVVSDSLTDSIVKQDYIRVFDGESSLEFNGSNSLLICNQGTIPDITGSFTFEAWIKPEGFGGADIGKIFDKTIISFFSYRSGNIVPADSCLVLMMAHAGGTVCTVYTASKSLKFNEWQHLAVTYNDTTSSVKIYINGEEQVLEMVKPPDGTISGNGTRPIVIGNTRNGNLAFKGYIDEARLWSCTRSPEEIKEMMEYNLPSDQEHLYGYWKMNEGINDTANDNSGNNQKGILRNTSWAQGVHLITLSTDEVRPAPATGFITVNTFPNPILQTGRIEIECRGEGICITEIISMTGARVKSFPFFNGFSGSHFTLVWDGTDDKGDPAPPGIYFLKVIQNGQSAIRKWILIGS